MDKESAASTANIAGMILGPMEFIFPEWKLAGGAKVLVSNKAFVNSIKEIGVRTFKSALKEGVLEE